MSRARSLANLANSGVFSADATTSRVGINSSAPERTLDVVGDGRVSGTLSIGGTINYEDVTSIDSIGVVTARDGVHIVSAGASIYSPANNELALYTNSSEKVRVNSSGSVGIGTDTSGFATRLVVGTGDGETGNMTLFSGTSSSSYIHFADGNSGADRYRGYVTYQHSDNSMLFGTNDVERLRITSGGVVKIGGDIEDEANDIDTTNTKLTIKQSAMNLEDGIYLERPSERRGHYIRVATSGNAQDALVFGTSQAGTETDHLLALDRSGNVTMTAGRLGIGTDNPEEILHIAAASETVNSRDGVLFESTSSLAADTGLPLVFTSNIGGGYSNYGVASIAGRKENATSSDGAGYLQFNTGASNGVISEKARIDSSGRMGIGIAPTTHNLHIHQNDSDNNFIHFTNTTTGSSAGDGALIGVDSSEQLLISQKENDNISIHTSNTERVLITNDGDTLFYGDAVQYAPNAFYIQTHAIDTSWTSYQTIATGLSDNTIYLVSINWSHGSPANEPYYYATSFLFHTANGTNGSSGENEKTFLHTTHTGGTGYFMTFRGIATAGGGSTGHKLQAKINTTWPGATTGNNLKLALTKVMNGTRSF